MSRIRNANRGTFKRFKKKQGALAVQTPLSSTAVERGSTRWLDGSRVDIEGILNLIGQMNASGVVDVTGTLNGSGTNNFDGTNNMSGINNMSGENHLTGPTDVAGNFEIIDGGQFKAGESLINPDGSAKFGALDIASDGTMKAGQFELRPDGSADFGGLQISKDGKITTGDTVIDTTGRAEFGSFIIDPTSNYPIQAPGGQMFSGGTGQIGLQNLNGSIDLSPDVSRLSYGATMLELTGNGTQMWGPVILMNAPAAPASELIPLGIDSNGAIRRIA